MSSFMTSLLVKGLWHFSASKNSSASFMFNDYEMDSSNLQDLQEGSKTSHQHAVRTVYWQTTKSAEFIWIMCTSAMWLMIHEAITMS